MKSFEVLLLMFLCIQTTISSVSSTNTAVVCSKAEKQALLSFKKGLKDPTNWLSSWIGEDCCTWKGVSCNNRTGHVVKAGPPFCSVGASVPYLDMSGINLSNSTDYLQVLNKLPSLRDLFLSSCELNPIHDLPAQLVNFSSLTIIDLLENNFNSLAPDWLFSIPSLVSLELSWNSFYGPIPVGLQNMTSLKILDLSENNFNSTIPDWLYNLRSLVTLDISDNNLRGSITSVVGNLTSITRLYLWGNELEESFGNLSQLGELYISHNSLEGEVSEVHFANLTRLKAFYASSTSLILKVSSDWIPPFQLQDIQMRSWHVGPQFPGWLQTQKSISYLDLSSTGISDEIPTWF
ncbi:receptor-like protein EIX2 [Macadamia integrifolia]|uniref:receptor-like protein EIX2 n=1 Tax=Macadamia integrifolia TaxID=60698 RepID=UPI001C52AFEE|nr:receptor-like protein EIX2 [Macadamia integrifolia]